MLNVQNADVYTDFNGLAKLKNEAKAKTPEAILEVAKQFESVFVGMMLKSMRQVKLAEGILDSKQSEFYRDMYDQQLSVHLAGERGIGLADLIVKQLSPDESATVVRGQKIADYERQLLSRKSVETRLDEVKVEAKDEAKGLLENKEPAEENPFWSGFPEFFRKSDAEEVPIVGESAGFAAATQRSASIMEQESGSPLASVGKHKDTQVQLKAGHEARLIDQADKRINSAEDFVNQLRPYAEKAAKELGVEANVLLSQAALETGWGKSIIKSRDGSSSHNLFNIKANKAWKGPQQKVATLEYKNGVARREMAGFRAYSSYQESFDDYVKFIKTNPRYKAAIKMAGKPERYMHELQQAGYATDPNYANKVMKIYQSKVVANQVLDTLAMKQPSIPDNS